MRTLTIIALAIASCTAPAATTAAPTLAGSGIATPADAPAPAIPLRPRTAFGQIAPQGGTITGVVAGSGLSGGGYGGAVTIELGSCGSGETQVSTGSGYVCASVGGVTSNACSSGWADAIGSDGSLTCSTPTATQVGAVSGSGTTNTIPKWTGSNTLGNSTLTDNGTAVSTSESLSIHGLTTSASAVVGGNTSATSYIESFTNSSGTPISGTAGLGTNDLWFQGTNAAATGYINDVGYNAGTTQARSLDVFDGQGSTSAHSIGLFDASTHGLFVGSGNTVAEDLSSNGAPSGTCGSGSIDRDYATDGGPFGCIAGSWYHELGILSPTNHYLLRNGATAGTALNSLVSDDSTNFTIPEHVVLGGSAATLTANSGTPTCASHSCNDTTGTVAMGSSATTVTVTFASAWTNTPNCFAIAQSSSTQEFYISSISTSAVTFVAAAGAFSSQKLSYFCIGT